MAAGAGCASFIIKTFLLFRNMAAANNYNSRRQWSGVDVRAARPEEKYRDYRIIQIYTGGCIKRLSPRILFVIYKKVADEMNLS